MKHIGNELTKLIRKTSNLKQYEIAEKLGMTRQNLSQVKEKPSIDAELLERIARFFNVPIQFFFDDDVQITQEGTVSIAAEPSVIYKKEENKDWKAEAEFLREECLRLHSLLEKFMQGDFVPADKSKGDLDRCG